ncbi:M20/M25/M40 family metallo-hydrolase [Desulfosporosinus sp. Sb-LF]|uniref:M20/M25/M40 family metallo-hydrolase n=1 Tax=Desulfosporosinus sp. Sb-LF TaxID=2560027 RepID=UPI00107F0EA4|nr:M20/M25/M40 family metallo-hydrolase [Desulfosporosinus sp. Sb-LF]TGE33407.1 M20/M25/M40 family metallo-hydrolase [Desulfosporosinus sp. Sb-LF]
MVNHIRILNEFLELVRITSPTLSERGIAEVLKHKLEAIGLRVIEDRAGRSIGGNCGNLIASMPSTLTSAPVLLLSAHMDCVEPCREVNPIVVDNIVRSSGKTILGGDDKAGLVSILEALRVIQEQSIPHGEIQVVFTVAEEGGLLGAKNIDRSLLHADFGYVLDSSGSPGKIINKAPGENSLIFKIFGRPAHAGIAPEDGLNAIILAAKALSQIPDGRINEKTTANIGIINGGVATNIVPEAVEINGGTRSHNLTELQLITEKIMNIIERVVNEHGGKSQVTVLKLYDPYELTMDMQVMAIAEKAIRSLGWEPDIKASGGGSDANYLNYYGIPCANLGIGTQQVHTNEEFIEINDLYKTAELLVEIIRRTPYLL